MSDDQAKLADPYNVPVTFVNEVAAIGFLNGVVNVTFTTARFSPIGEKVETDSIVASRLRLDLHCAQALRDFLDKIVDENTKGPAQPTGTNH